MRKNWFYSLFGVLSACLMLNSCTAEAEMMELSFDYARQQTHGSNQYAVWVENEAGELVKTLYVTTFTALGRSRGDEKPQRGYEFRPACVPHWVKAACPEKMSDEQLDAISGATPAEDGRQTFVWDFTDAEGNKVEQGKYRMLLEANFFDESQVLYTAEFEVGDAPAEVECEALFSMPDDERFKGMIGNVTAALK